MKIKLAILAIIVSFLGGSTTEGQFQGGALCWRTSVFDCTYCPGELNYSCIPDPHGPYKACSVTIEWCVQDVSGCNSELTTSTGMSCPQF